MDSACSASEMQETAILPVDIKLEVEETDEEPAVENDEHFEQYLLPVKEEEEESRMDSSDKGMEPYPVSIKEEPPEYIEQQVHPEWIIPDVDLPTDLPTAGGDSGCIDVNSSSYSCELCSLSYTTLDHLYEHITTSHTYSQQGGQPGVLERKCPFCAFTTSEMITLQKHIQDAHPKSNDVNACDICGKVFTSNRYLSHHKVVHSAEKRFTCETCGKQFRREGDYNMHLSTHTQKPSECKICGKKFGLHRNLLQHEIIHREPEKKFECTLCDKRFRRHCDYQAHVNSHTSDPYRCSVCDRTFPLRRNLLQHEVVHTQVRNYECEICAKKFRRQCDYNLHVQVHSNQAYVCSLCGKAFSLKRSLVQHLGGHKVKTIGCEICGKEFKRKSQYGRHLPCRGPLPGSNVRPATAAYGPRGNFGNVTPLGSDGGSATNYAGLPNNRIIGKISTAFPDITITSSSGAIVTITSTTIDDKGVDGSSPVPHAAAGGESVLRNALSMPPSISLTQNGADRLSKNGTELQQIVSKLLTKHLSNTAIKTGVQLIPDKEPLATSKAPEVESS